MFETISNVASTIWSWIKAPFVAISETSYRYSLRVFSGVAALTEGMNEGFKLIGQFFAAYLLGTVVGTLTNAVMLIAGLFVAPLPAALLAIAFYVPALWGLLDACFAPRNTYEVQTDNLAVSLRDLINQLNARRAQQA